MRNVKKIIQKNRIGISENFEFEKIFIQKDWLDKSLMC